MKIKKSDLLNMIQGQNDVIAKLIRQVNCHHKDIIRIEGVVEPEPQLKQLDQDDDIAKELSEFDLSSELTGSDLCRKMLERGDRFVMCMVANNEANMFLATRPVVVHGCTDSDFISISGCYSFAVAVNNQGEPLTASEVGL